MCLFSRFLKNRDLKQEQEKQYEQHLSIYNTKSQNNTSLNTHLAQQQRENNRIISII